MSSANNSPIRAIVFDLDGTLVDAFADIAAAMNHPLAARRLPIHDVNSIRQMVGEGVFRLIDRAAPGLPPDELDRIHAEMMEFYGAHPADHASVYQGVFPLLELLKYRGFRLAVLSNKPHVMTIATCELLGLAKYFDDIAGEDDPRVPRKPDPRGLLQQLARLRATDAVLVGDGVPDGQTALAAGIPFVAALWGTRSREDLAPFNPIAYAEKAEDLAMILV